MRKKMVFVVPLFLFTFVVASNALARQNGNGVANAQSEGETAATTSSNVNSTGQTNGNGNNGSVSSTSSTDSSQVQIQNQAQTRTNNPGVGTMTEEQFETQIQEQIKESKPEYSPRNQKATERMSTVAKAAEELIRLSNRVENQGIGEQIREIARVQNQNQDKVNKSLDKADTRTGFAKFFIGANFQELTSTKKTMLENQNQIKELKSLMESLEADADKLTISNQIIALQEQNMELRDQIETASEGFSLFGWLNRWYNKF